MIKKIVGLLMSLALSIFLVAAPGWAIDVSLGDRVELTARSSLGVPLHKVASSSLIGRAEDGTIGTVLGTANNQRWVEIELPNGNDRWVSERYIGQVFASQNATDADSAAMAMPIGLFPELSGEALRSQLSAEYSVKNRLGYNAARDYMYSQLDNDNGVVRGIYSGFEVAVDPQSPRPRTEAYQDGRGINAEHSWPQSKGATGVAKSDLHHLFPARGKINSRRSSLPFAEIDDRKTKAWILNNRVFRDIPMSDIDAYSESTGEAFEPREAVKGNLARALFYFNTMYRDQADQNFFQEQQRDLCEWNRLDPVDDAEMARNKAIAAKQGNENPFVVDAGLAKRLYCER